MLCAILNSLSGFKSGAKVLKSSSDLKFSWAALNVSLSQWNQLNKLWHQQICYFGLIGCTHFSVINVFWLFCKCVTHLNLSSACAPRSHGIKGFPVLSWAYLIQVLWKVQFLLPLFFFIIILYYLYSLFYFHKADAPKDRNVLYLQRKQTWLSYRSFSSL